jgi:hypothetical protein
LRRAVFAGVFQKWCISPLCIDYLPYIAPCIASDTVFADGTPSSAERRYKPCSRLKRSADHCAVASTARPAFQRGDWNAAVQYYKEAMQGTTPDAVNARHDFAVFLLVRNSAIPFMHDLRCLRLETPGTR